MPAHYFYLARCGDGSLYAGTCMDLADRERKHNDGTGAKYTRSRLPVKMVYHEEFETLSDARKREAEVKRWDKTTKEQLVHPQNITPLASSPSSSIPSSDLWCDAPTSGA